MGVDSARPYPSLIPKVKLQELCSSQEWELQFKLQLLPTILFHKRAYSFIP
jgi:hypothetical protein